MRLTKSQRLLVPALMLLTCVTVSRPATGAKENNSLRQKGMKRGATTEGFQLSLQAEKNVVGILDGFILKLDLKNASQQTLSVKDQADWYDYEVDARDESGQKVALTEKGKQVEKSRERWQEISARFWRIKPGKA